MLKSQNALVLKNIQFDFDSKDIGAARCQFIVPFLDLLLFAQHQRELNFILIVFGVSSI